MTDDHDPGSAIWDDTGALLLVCTLLAAAGVFLFSFI
jgi:hypothetical protein